MGAPVTWFDVSSENPKRLGEFYTQLFGWSLAPSGDDGYSLIDTGAGDGAVGGGIGTARSFEETQSTTVYFRVPDLRATLDTAIELGGTEILPPTALPGDYGSFALFADPDGRTIGLMG
jgi:predicted enzyme related to lactoylglutathione lyase